MYYTDLVKKLKLEQKGGNTARIELLQELILEEQSKFKKVRENIAFGMNDYNVIITVDQHSKIIDIVAAEDIEEEEEINYKKGDKIKLTKVELRSIEESL